MATVRILNYFIQGEFGDTIRAYGYDFIIQKDGEATCEMSDASALREVRAGRVQIVNAVAKTTSLFADMTPTPENFFGCETVTILQEKLKIHAAANLMLFAKKFMDLEIPGGMSRTTILATICKKAEELAEPKGE